MRVDREGLKDGEKERERKKVRGMFPREVRGRQSVVRRRRRQMLIRVIISFHSIVAVVVVAVIIQRTNVFRSRTAIYSVDLNSTYRRSSYLIPFFFCLSKFFIRIAFPFDKIIDEKKKNLEIKFAK